MTLAALKIPIRLRAIASRCLSAALLLGAMPALGNPEEGETVKQEQDTGHAFCDLLDLEKPALAEVKGFVDRGDYVGAMTAYRDRLVNLAAKLNMGKPPGFWLWGATKAEDLLTSGIVATAQYGEFNRVTRYTLGTPGSTQWNKVPEDGYDVVLRDLSTMHWTGRLVESYLTNREPAYLKAYLGYWDDYARNWLPAHQKLMKSGTQIMWDHRPHVRSSLSWAGGSKLYFAWRLDNLASWLSAGLAASPDRAKASVDPGQLATVIHHVAKFEVPGAIRGLQDVGVPNQFVHCALGLLKTSLLFQDLREADAWRKKALERMEWYVASSGYLQDGSDMEQSFNYNPGLIHALDSILQLARDNPPLKGRTFAWQARFQEARDCRERFLDCVVMPDGRRPATGCDNTWASYSRSKAIAEYNKGRKTLSPLQQRISNHILGDATIAEPAFTSVYFPYGGWVVMRNGWTPNSAYAFMKTSRPGPGHMREGGNGLALGAYGRYLVVNSGADAYSERGVFDRYFDSTVSQSSLSVDGFSQVLNAGKAKPQYDKPINARWHTSRYFDVAEGIFDSKYGGWNFRTGKEESPLIDDVRHERQLLFLRQPGVWIVTDRIRSGREHDYTQSWCLGPDFTDAEVAVGPDGRSASTHDTNGPNVELHFASEAPLACSRHYGEKSGSTALGWRAFDWNEKESRYARSVDLLTDWHGKGDQLAATLIVPSSGDTTRIASYRELSTNGVTGFEARLKDNYRLTYLASQGGPLKIGVVTVDGQAFLMLTDPAGATRGVVLDSNGRSGYEFELNGTDKIRKLADIQIPTGFCWVGSPEKLRPEYTRAPSAK